MVGLKNKILIVLLCISNIVLGQKQEDTLIDTVNCFRKNIIIKYPAINKIKDINYEEGYFKIINCILDTATITIHCGGMVHLPLTDLTNKIIYSQFTLDKDVRIIRGYYIVNERRKYFREENYFKYGITLVYENINEDKLMYYESIFNNLKIE